MTETYHEQDIYPQSSTILIHTNYHTHTHFNSLTTLKEKFKKYIPLQFLEYTPLHS